MKIHFEKEGFNTYMVIPYNGDWKETYENQLFQFHEIPYFLNVEWRSCNENQAIYYQLKYRTTLKDIFHHISFTREKMCNFVDSIISGIEMIEEYLLDFDQIIWNKDCIFIEADTGKLEFCYSFDGEEKGELKKLLLEILEKLDRKNEELYLLFLKFYNLITDPNCNLHKLQMFRKNELESQDEKYKYNLEKDMDMQKNQVKEENENSQNLFEKIIRSLLYFVAGINILLIIGLIFNFFSYEKLIYLFVGLGVLIALIIINIYITKDVSEDDIMQEYFESEEKKEIIGKKSEHENKDNLDMKFGETVLLAENCNNCRKEQLLEEEKIKELYFEPLKNTRYAPIYIKEESIVLGCMQDSHNYCLKEKGISRMHAKIIKKPEGLYLFDLNSTNGTFINGEQLEGGKEYGLEKGDLIKFANVEFCIAEKEENPQVEKEIRGCYNRKTTEDIYG